MTRRYAIVGTGSRAQMYLEALLTTHSAVGSPVAFCEPNEVRMGYYDELLAAHGVRANHYKPADFERMLDVERPNAVIVTSPDFTHARYLSAALRRDLDVIVEKPLTTDAAGVREILDAAAGSAGRLIVTFNYRYSPRNSVLKKIVQSGQIGDVTSVHFEWCLDTVHGADYFRRWHRDKANSGGLLVHKSSHHFDLVNWWIDDVPEVVFAHGGLRFYGPENARERGLAPRPERSRDVLGTGDPFALDIAADDKLRRLFLEGEAEDGYVRDRDVFSDGITIEDNLSLVVGYRRGVSLAYSLTAHAPWEGYRVAINGTEGRVELDVVERAHVPGTGTAALLGPKGKEKAAPVVDPSAVPDAPGTATIRPHGSRILLQRHWEPARYIEIPDGAGAHGGGDAMLLDDVFHGADPADELRRQAGHDDGVRSVLVGIAGNRSLETGQAVRLADLDVPLLDAQQTAG